MMLKKNQKIKTVNTKYCIGQCVLNHLFDYRGVIVDIDACYTGTSIWYKKNAPHRPKKNQPWYYILVHNSSYRIYVAESVLSLDSSGESIHHPEIDYFFSAFKNGIYLLHDMYKS